MDEHAVPIWRLDGQYAIHFLDRHLVCPPPTSARCVDFLSPPRDLCGNGKGIRFTVKPNR